jgi:hypothetical protein
MLLVTAPATLELPFPPGDPPIWLKLLPSAEYPPTPLFAAPRKPPFVTFAILVFPPTLPSVLEAPGIPPAPTARLNSSPGVTVYSEKANPPPPPAPPAPNEALFAAEAYPPPPPAPTANTAILLTPAGTIKFCDVFAVNASE